MLPPRVFDEQRFLLCCGMPPGETSTAQPSATSQSQASSHEEGLRHQLTAGQMAMVAVGGSIGTGLLLGSAAALEVAGPSVILSYIVAAFLAYTVAIALRALALM